MNIEEFEDLLDRHGNDFAVWPAEKREAASRLLLSSSQARMLHAEAVVLRGALSSQPIKASQSLLDRISALPTEQTETQLPPFAVKTAPFLGLKQLALFFGLTFVVGVAIGIATAGNAHPSTAASVRDYLAYVVNFAYTID